MVHGFVEELVVNEDPEYQWIDRIRTPRASNEARQRLIFLMSGTNTQRVCKNELKIYVDVMQLKMSCIKCLDMLLVVLVFFKELSGWLSIYNG